MARIATGRKAISKGLRFAVLDRDRHTCQYCGRTAPEVKLTIDHIVPVSAGGDNEHTNLVAACADCNAGKGSKLALRIVDNAELAANLAALKERRRLLKATAKAEKALRTEREDRIWAIARHWIKVFRGEPEDGNDWTINSRFFSSLSSLLEWMPVDEIEELMDSVGRRWANGQFATETTAIKYFSGCVRNVREQRKGFDSPNGDIL